MYLAFVKISINIPGTNEIRRLRGQFMFIQAHIGMLCNPISQATAHITSISSIRPAACAQIAPARRSVAAEAWNGGRLSVTLVRELTIAHIVGAVVC